MRFLSWWGGLATVVVLGAGVGGASLAHGQANSAKTLTASRQQAAAPAIISSDPEMAPRHMVSPHSQPSTSNSSGFTSSPASVGQSASRPVPVAAAPAIVVNSTQQAFINQDRASYGLAPLTWSSCLYGVAQAQASYLATPGVPFQHYSGVQQDLSCHLGRQVGENIGWWSGGVNDSQLNTMFMNSPDHKANILGPYHYVATAWAVRSDGHAYIAVEFG
jgi:uncharacterized protein YkwD